jgi:hypothetical protein
MVTWLLIGTHLFDGRFDWALCFVGYSGLIAGFWRGILFIFSHDDQA